MTFLTLSFMIFITVYVFVEIPGIVPINFPLDDCTQREMDILALYFVNGDAEDRDTQLTLYYSFVRHVLSFVYNKTSPRVLYADVYDNFSEDNPNINTSSWHFHQSLGSEPYGFDNSHVISQEYKTVEDVLTQKIELVQHLFSEMTGVRESAMHIAVIYLDGEGYSYDELRNVPDIVQKQYTHINVLVVAFGGKHEQELIQLSNTLLLTNNNNVRSRCALILAICKQCMEGWFLFDHSDSHDSLSCYQFLDTYPQKINWHQAMNNCYNISGSLAGIETIEEFSFLQTRLQWYVNEHSASGDVFRASSQLLAHVYIGLARGTSLGKRFQWSLVNPVRFRPLIINKWVLGKPSGGPSMACGMWQLVWHGNEIDTHFFNNREGSITGWTDVPCRTKKSTFSLCETVLYRRRANTKVITISPASEESYVKALDFGIFETIENNIVYVPALTKRTTFIKETRNEFPIFDCREDVGYPRYIPYIYVCDYIDHCDNRRDETNCPDNLYSDSICKYGPYMPLKSVYCDLINDCYDGSDEADCNTKCQGVYCCDGSCLPIQFVNDGVIDCAVCEHSSVGQINDENEVLNHYLQDNVTCAFTCNGGYCVHSFMLDDEINECGQPREPLDETIGKLETANTCHNLLGHTIWAPRCVYVKDEFEIVIGCRDMSHLMDCADFACAEGYVKCPNAYCIRQHYVLDGKADCPTGDDEHSESIDPCSGNFVCWNSKICLHPDQVCDGHPHCPHRDDEIECGLFCFAGLRCGLGTVTISDYNISNLYYGYIKIDWRAKYIDLSGIDLSNGKLVVGSSFCEGMFLHFSNCKIINLENLFNQFACRIHTLDISYNLLHVVDGIDELNTLFVLEDMRYLNLSYNIRLVLVTNFRFQFLEILDLSHTNLSYLEENFFVHLLNIKDLNLSFTLIFDLNKIMFQSSFTLQTLNLLGLYLNNLNRDYFKGLTVSQHLYTDQYEMCCPVIRGINIPYYSCHGPQDAISSCVDLLGAYVQRVLLWHIAVIAIVGNMVFIVYRVVWDRSFMKTGYGLFVINLSISDIIMGVYLSIIVGSDYYYRGRYVLYDKSWRESTVCKLAGFLATISIEMATFCIFFITLDIYLAMKFPFAQIKVTNIGKGVALLSSWIICFLVALTPAVFRLEIYSTNAICFYLPLTTKRPKGWEYTFGVFIVNNFVLFLFAAYGQIAIFRVMPMNRPARPDSSTPSHRPEYIVLTKQLSLVVLSNFLCWFSIGIIGFFVFGGQNISIEVYAWTMLIVIPINSAIHPLLYAIFELIAKWEKFKYGDTRST